ncbi:MAG: lysophospholipid acyltransferase family protein [Micrococcaceae bacterium]
MARKDASQTDIAWRVLGSAANRLTRMLLKIEWLRTDKLPKDGAFIATPNHLTNADPVVLTGFFYANGYASKFLTKGALFKNKIAGAALRSIGQIPVYRDAKDPSRALSEARQELANDSTIVIYPEGTFTRDPKRWPMKGKTGAARLALETDTPVIPIAHWGLLDFMPIGTAKVKLNRPKVKVLVGNPVDLSEFKGKEIDRDLLHDATEKIMDAVTELLEELRGEKVPEHRWDMKTDGNAIIDDDGNVIADDIHKDS